MRPEPRSREAGAGHAAPQGHGLHLAGGFHAPHLHAELPSAEPHADSGPELSVKMVRKLSAEAFLKLRLPREVAEGSSDGSEARGALGREVDDLGLTEEGQQMVGAQAVEREAPQPNLIACRGGKSLQRRGRLARLVRLQNGEPPCGGVVAFGIRCETKGFQGEAHALHILRSSLAPMAHRRRLTAHSQGGRVSEAGEGARALHEAMSMLQRGDAAGVSVKALAALEAFTAANDRTGAAAAHQVAAIGCVATGRLTEALEHVDAGIALRESTGDIEGVASLWQERLELCLRTGDLPAARQAAEAQVETWTRTTQTEGLAHARHQLAQLLLEMGEDGQAEANVQEALYALDPTAHARARSALNLLYSNIWLLRRDRDRALAQAREGLDMARAAKNRAAEIDALQQCGVVHAASNELPAAQRALQEALVGRELLKDLPGRASVLRELAGVELAAGDIEGAIEHLDYAARTLKEVGNVGGEIAMLQALAEASDNAGKTEVGLDAATRLCDAARRTGDREAEAGAWFMLATRAAGCQELGKAQRAFKMANEIQEILGLAHEAAVSQGMLGQVMAAAGDVAGGRLLLQASLARLEALNSEAADTLREVLAELDPATPSPRS